MADFRHWHDPCLPLRQPILTFDGDYHVTKKTLLKLAAAAVAFAAPSLASATTMNTVFNSGASTLQNVSISFNATSGSPTWSTVGAGRLAFDVSAHDALDPVSSMIYTFCIEPTQYIQGAPTVVTYQVDALKDSQLVSTPVIKLSDDASYPGTDTKAALISQLFAKVYAYTGTQFLQQGTSINADVAAAMQFAVWEIIEETSSTYSVTSGNAQFKMTDNGTYSSVTAHTNAVASLANTYLGLLTQGGAGVNGIFALDSTSAQNQIGQYNVTTTPSRLDVPEPATLGLFGFGALAMGLRRRKAK